MKAERKWQATSIELSKTPEGMLLTECQRLVIMELGLDADPPRCEACQVSRVDVIQLSAIKAMKHYAADQNAALQAKLDTACEAVKAGMAEVAGLRTALTEVDARLAEMGCAVGDSTNRNNRRIIADALASPSAAWERSKREFAADELEKLADRLDQEHLGAFTQCHFIRARAAALRAQGE